jgi:hypothetical protein
MRYLLLSTLLLIKVGVISAQLSNLKGTWITDESELILINDTASLDAGNYLATKNNEKNFLLFLHGDTLSFQEHYTTSADKFKEVHIKKYDLKFNRVGDSLLIIKPASDLAFDLFDKKPTLSFTRKKFIADTSIHFEKIIFHTTSCFGSCSTYHLQVDNQKKIKLYAERVHREGSSFFLDSTKMGRYTGDLNDADYSKLIKELRTCNLRTLGFNDIECCDGSVITIIVYFNGQRKYLKSMVPPIIANDLISWLYHICSYETLKKTDSYFTVEE